jgi:hypothetical protein
MTHQRLSLTLLVAPLACLAPHYTLRREALYDVIREQKYRGVTL